MSAVLDPVAFDPARPSQGGPGAGEITSPFGGMTAAVSVRFHSELFACGGA